MSRHGLHRLTTPRAALLAGVAALALSAALAQPAAPAVARPSLDQPRSNATSTQLSRLTLAQLAGQRSIYSYSGSTPPAQLFRLIRSGQVAGVIFYAENITGRAQIRGVTRRLDAAQKVSPVKEPLLLMTDQEGGPVSRLAGPPALSPGQIGRSGRRVSEARRAGTGAGNNLRGVGMNVNLAPVLGVFRRPGDFLDQFGRSYSMNPRVVRQLAPEFITAQQRTGVAATAKHFPGLGAATAEENTDERPVTLNLSQRALRQVDMLPYPAAISAGVELVMMSWAVYPALDRNRPAGLSRRVIRGHLRNRLGFSGVTITDALEAGALTRFGSFGNRSVLAAEAGADLLLFSARSVTQGNEGSSALIGAVRNGRLSRASFEAAAGRVLDLRKRLARRKPLSGP